MMRTNPFDEFETFFDRMSRQYDEMMRRESGIVTDVATDVADHDDELVVTVDLPGFEREEVDVSTTENRLTVRAEHEFDEERESPSGEYLRRERRHESVRRTIDLPLEVDGDAASAVYRNGVLTVTLPKLHVSEESRRIDIE
ncbi:MAG: Hsp20/alpha crystallin family protein [Haloferacaceae archaeon]